MKSLMLLNKTLLAGSRINSPAESPRSQKHDHLQQLSSCWVCRGTARPRPQSAARTGTWPAGISSSAASHRGSSLKRHTDAG